MDFERLLDREAVIACVRDIACGADAHDWALVAACFDREVLVDYVSLAGGAPVWLRPEQIVEAWEGLLPGFEITRYRLSNFRVSWEADGQAVCCSYVDALHVIPGARGGDFWRVVGEYAHRLVRREAGWKVAAMRFVKDHLWGNQSLPELAQARLQPRVREVSFAGEEGELAGHLYVPGDWDESGSLSAVLVCGPWGAVKEQMAGAYARELAVKGFAALAFDHRGFGRSAGEPRECEWPERKIQDCLAALCFLQSRPEIDFERIFGLGLGAGAGYLLCAAAKDTRIKGLALVGAWLHQPGALAAVYGGEERVARLIRDGLEAQWAYEALGSVAYVPAAEVMEANPAMAGELACCRESGPLAASGWGGRFALMAWPGWLDFDPLARAGGVAAPTLLIHSREAFHPPGVEACFQALGGPKSLFWVQGSQADLYASPVLRTVCTRRMADYFRNVLV